MKAAVNRTYGPAEKVVHIDDIARPEAAEKEVLVKVYTTSVSTGQWRMVEMNAGGVLQIAARAMFGFFRPRSPVQGGSYAGRVVSVGEKVTRFKLGDEVFGFTIFGAHAEFLAIAEDKAVVKKPATMGYDEAAALPFGGLSALNFLRDFAKLEPGQRVLVTGASGGVGSFGVQIAKHLGAEVTGLASTGNVDLVRSLGADHVVDYKLQDVTASGAQFDIIFDTAGVLKFADARKILADNGRFVPLEFGVPLIIRSLRTHERGIKIVIGVNGDKAEDLETLAGLVTAGKLRAVIDSTYPLERITEAYARVAGRHKTGAVVINVGLPEQAKLAAE